MAGERQERRLARDCPDSRAIALSENSESVLDIRELRSCGFSDNAVATRVRRGWLTPIHEGVYAVGRRQLTLEGRFVAAVKACGERAALSHYTCTVFGGMLEWEERPIDVTVRSQGIRTHSGVRVHRSKLLQRQDLRFRSGMWVVSPGWAVLGLASQVGAETLKQAVRRGFAHEHFSVRSLAALLRRAGPIRGSRKLGDVISEGYRPTRTVFEDIVLDLIIESGFVLPEVNAKLVVAGQVLYPDFRWPEQRLIVEADSRMWHDDPISVAEDAARQALLEASGERFIRVTFDQATTGRAQTEARIARAGAPRCADPPPRASTDSP
jgi:very-short-patch-repair endonuclease